jgi:hypothetical protein
MGHYRYRRIRLFFSDYDYEHRFAEHEHEGWDVMAGFVLVRVRVIVIGLYFTSMPVVSRLASNQTLTTTPCVKCVPWSALRGEG